VVDSPAWLRRPRTWLIALGVIALVGYPFAPLLDQAVLAATGSQLRLDRALVNLFIFAILALALNLQVGYSGLLQLGIAAFFGIGAFTTGVLTVDQFPFQLGTWGAVALVPLWAGLAGLCLGAPTIRLRGDYLAIVTLGFGEVVRVVLVQLEAITNGPRGLNPLPTPWLPPPLAESLAGGAEQGRDHYLTMYFVALGCLLALVVILRTLERTRGGRAFMALREDELASACMGINPARTKLMAFTAGAAIAGLAGALYATNLRTTGEPGNYGFNESIIVLSCVIIGGLGSLRGAILGVFVLYGFDQVVSPLVSQLIKRASAGGGNVLTDFGNWRLMIFGLAMILTMRFRPEGLWPSARTRLEMHRD
jgi:branched-chain amino acid transport system permease protein